ncbi:adenosylcobinamide-GDP ribazoletransferase [uncultured Amaricoccus sp.]|uniref:adenosylcobinamide-GDP ribazoletransferase n=1 Tax=uncultured Amaricoccus sp. TaxID=339341 RepID=UPI002628D6E2|nr:adenosylcobinamide-GDP ribazoletransferase [uncultured Amaricoccus sp.]
MTLLPASGRLRHEAAAFLLALGFLPRLPVGRTAYSPGRMAAATGYFPAAGLVVGLVAAALLLAAARILPQVVALLLAAAATCLLTGALHEDGLADTADGLAGGATPERALEIMRDSRIGTCGALALGLAIALRIATLAAMPLSIAATALVAGHAASRASMTLVVATSRYARPSGAGSFTAGGTSPRRLALALATAGIALLPLVLAAGWLAGLGALLGLAAGPLASRGFERRLGGYTGDTLGATQQVSEIGLGLGLLACL